VVEKDGTAISNILICFNTSSIQEMVLKKVVLVLYVVEEACVSPGVFTTAYDIDPEWNDLGVSQVSFGGGSGGTLIGSFGEVEDGIWSDLDVTLSAFIEDAAFLHTVVTFRGRWQAPLPNL
jgi:hypothetical protein